MSEKLCLQWNDFKENVDSAFARLREDKEFIDVSLVSGDGGSQSHPDFFKSILQKNTLED